MQVSWNFIDTDVDEEGGQLVSLLLKHGPEEMALINRSHIKQPACSSCTGLE